MTSLGATVATLAATGVIVDSGDAKDLGELYLKAGRAAIAKTAALIGNRQAAEDIVQDVFSRLWSARLRFPSQRAGFFWIYKSCHRAGIDYLRSGRVRFEAQGLSECEDMRHRYAVLVEFLGDILSNAYPLDWIKTRAQTLKDREKS